jgi:hypothetical protein
MLAFERRRRIAQVVGLARTVPCNDDMAVRLGRTISWCVTWGLAIGCGGEASEDPFGPVVQPTVPDGGDASGGLDTGVDDADTDGTADDDAGSDGDPMMPMMPMMPTVPTITGRCHEAPPAGAVSPPPPPVYSGGACPMLEPGYVTGFTSQGRARELALVVPTDYDDARIYPLVFMWYHLSGDAMSFVDTLGAQAIADSAQAILVVPQATGDFEFVWPDTPLDVGQSAVDLGLFDDALACLSAQYSVNPSCVSSLGVSAGGLWTAYLGQQRGQYLASNLVVSGGYPTEFGSAWWSWTPSPHKFASLVIWGGPSDQLGIDFHAASTNYITHVRGDGHFVLECEHTGGHGLPPVDPSGASDAIAAVAEFIVDHPYWQEGTSLLQTEGIPAHWPGYCHL